MSLTKKEIEKLGKVKVKKKSEEVWRVFSVGTVLAVGYLFLKKMGYGTDIERPNTLIPDRIAQSPGKNIAVYGVQFWTDPTRSNGLYLKIGNQSYGPFTGAPTQEQLAMIDQFLGKIKAEPGAVDFYVKDSYPAILTNYARDFLKNSGVIFSEVKTSVPMNQLATGG